MNPTTFEIVFPLTVLVLLGIGVPSFMVGANWLLHRQRKTYASKEQAYECGLSRTVGTADERFTVKFYLVAMIFLAFDIEVAFLYPWAIQFLKGDWGMFAILAAFLAMLEAVYLYLWNKGALSW